MIDLNTANAGALDGIDLLRGHGFEIVRYREERGRFTSLRRLDEVPGLAGKTDGVRAHVSVVAPKRPKGSASAVTMTEPSRDVVGITLLDVERPAFFDRPNLSRRRTSPHFLRRHLDRTIRTSRNLPLSRQQR